MKTKLILSITIFLVASTIVYSQMTFPITAGDNPVMEVTESWEEGGLMFPYIYYEDGTFYLFYTAGDMWNGNTCIGLATSTDGYIFTQKDSIFGWDGSGFDAYSVCASVVTKKDDTYYLFYAGANGPGFCSDGLTGQATASNIYGPYERLEEPILEPGSSGEWDDHGVGPDQVFDTDSGFVLYFVGSIWDAYPEQEGVAHFNGSEWIKYDDPTTTNPPFAESDPVLKYGSPGTWDDWCASMVTVNQIPSGWEMLFQAGNSNSNWTIGYATSMDGIEWIKMENPVYSYLDDLFAQMWGFTITGSPTIIVVDNYYYIYYDYGDCFDYLGMATTTSIQAHNLEPEPIFPLTASEDNPVIEATESWEEGGLMFPFIYYEDSIYYLLYTAGDVWNGPTYIGLATSNDGFNFTEKDSIFGPDGTGFDAYSVCFPVVTKKDDTYYLFYAAADQQGFASEGFTGQATASNIYGPYERLENMILGPGSPGEWDDKGAIPDQVFDTDSGLMMYYTGTTYTDYPEQEGLAYYNGSEWVKYNDPHTTNLPFAESDPILKFGNPGSWDDWCTSMVTVNQITEGWEMFYQAGSSDWSWRIGYATSADGIHWVKKEEPVYSYLDDPFAQMWGFNIIASPTLVVVDNKYYLYYDYGNGYDYLGMATAWSIHALNVVAEEAAPIEDNSFYANWQASEIASAYLLDVSLNENFETFVAGYENLDVGDMTSFEVTGLNPSTTYYYRLRAYMETDTGFYSNVVSLVTLIDSYMNPVQDEITIWSSGKQVCVNLLGNQKVNATVRIHTQSGQLLGTYILDKKQNSISLFVDRQILIIQVQTKDQIVTKKLLVW